MNDYNLMPDICTVVRRGDFTLRIMAYRKLTQDEAFKAAYQYLRENHKKRFPVKGSAIFCIPIGIDG